MMLWSKVSKALLRSKNIRPVNLWEGFDDCERWQHRRRIPIEWLPGWSAIFPLREECVENIPRFGITNWGHEQFSLLWRKQWLKKWFSLYEKNVRSRIVSHDLILCDPVTIINCQCPATTLHHYLYCRAFTGLSWLTSSIMLLLKCCLTQSASNYCLHSFRTGDATFAFCHDAPNQSTRRLEESSLRGRRQNPPFPFSFKRLPCRLGRVLPI